jgi:signal transduction histidine kinase
MEKSITRQLEAVRRFVDVRRLNARSSKFAAEPVSLAELLEATLEDHRASIQETRINVSVNVEPVTVMSDAVALGHVFSNIIDNAIKYRNRFAQPWIRIFSVGADDRINIMFADNGVGLTQEEVRQVFQRYFKADESSDGSGLGLSLSKALIEEIGGQLWLQSPGKNMGTTVVVALPR